MVSSHSVSRYLQVPEAKEMNDVQTKEDLHASVLDAQYGSEKGGSVHAI